MNPALARRIGAIFLPDLSCELAASTSDLRELPLGVICTEHETKPGEEAELGKELSAVNDVARRFGIRAGQKVAEARALHAGLVVRGIAERVIMSALGRVAEVALAFGTTASIEPCDEPTPRDTVLIDLTGAAHLSGGEEATLDELASRVRALGHRVRASIAGGPRLARAVAMFGPSAETIVLPEQAASLVQTFPLDALPLDREHKVWLNRLGLWTIGDLVKLPRESLSSRLGDGWQVALDLALGRDDCSLVAYEPPRQPSESVEWEESVISIEPLLFSLKALVSRLSARLEGRGEAAQSIELRAPYDASIAKLRGIREDAPGLSLRIDLPSPLSHKEDLFRVMKSKLEHARLQAPVTGLVITAFALTHAPRWQLRLDGDASEETDPRQLAVLLAELSAEIGKENVGVLEVVPVHRPEGRTKLMPLESFAARRKKGEREPLPESDDEFPVRLLASPVPLEFLQGGQLVSIDHHLFSISGKSRLIRFDHVEWWKESPMSRDYMRVWLTSGKKKVEAWVFTDKTSGKSYVHGYFD